VSEGRGRGKKARKARREPADLSRPLDRLGWEVPEEEHGERLDRFLAPRLSWRSRTSVVELIQDGQVLRDGQALTRKAQRVNQGERIEVLVPPPAEEERHEELAILLEEAVLHEDEDLIALSKPPGLIVHPVGRVRVNTMVQALHWLYRFRRGEPQTRPRVCHRLDRDTSGVIVFAKNQAARSALGIAIETHLPLAIGPDPADEPGMRMATRPDGAPSLSRWALLERFEEASLVRFEIKTGRQHQIRVHARALGHPVLLDALYGAGPTAWPVGAAPVISRQALHARRLTLPHPRTGRPLTLEAELPADMQALLEELRSAP
jgi:23S rRNA pseudouridine1911/1915/1917 synthase